MVQQYPIPPSAPSPSRGHDLPMVTRGGGSWVGSGAGATTRTETGGPHLQALLDSCPDCSICSEPQLPLSFPFGSALAVGSPPSPLACPHHPCCGLGLRDSRSLSWAGQDGETAGQTWSCLFSLAAQGHVGELGGGKAGEPLGEHLPWEAEGQPAHFPWEHPAHHPTSE